jgi:hypothetical protein
MSDRELSNPVELTDAELDHVAGGRARSTITTIPAGCPYITTPQSFPPQQIIRPGSKVSSTTPTPRQHNRRYGITHFRRERGRQLRRLPLLA